jgi:hypothetical protein
VAQIVFLFERKASYGLLVLGLFRLCCSHPAQKGSSRRSRNPAANRVTETHLGPLLMDSSPSPSPAPSRAASDASLRWGILRRSLLARSSSSHASGYIWLLSLRPPPNNYFARFVSCSTRFRLISRHQPIQRNEKTPSPGGPAESIYLCFFPHSSHRHMIPLPRMRSSSTRVNE